MCLCARVWSGVCVLVRTALSSRLNHACGQACFERCGLGSGLYACMSRVRESCA